MANVLDLRRRIRSVKNTRQITKAMKMVSAAKLRRAQERAMQARPYARMLSNVLESLVRRTDLCTQTGDVLHPLLVEREEKNVLVIVVAGDKGFAGAFNSNIGKAAQRFIDERREQGQNVDLEPVGRRRSRLFHKRYPAGELREDGGALRQRSLHALRYHPPSRAADRDYRRPSRRCCSRSTSTKYRDMAHSIIERYERAEIDSVYLVYNEFKSVISQRVVVEKAAADSQARFA